MTRRSFTLGTALFALALLHGTAGAAIPFEVRTITNNLDLWPAAVAQSIGGSMSYRGAIHYDPLTLTVRYTRTFSGTTFQSDSILLGVSPGRMAATTDRWDRAIHACFYLELGGQGHLNYATKNLSGAWTLETVASGSHVGEVCAIGHRTDLGPVLVFLDPSVSGQSTLRYASKALGFWSYQTLDDASDSDPISSPSIATDKQSATHIAWINRTAGEVRYCQGPGTTIETVGSASGVGSLAIAVDRTGAPRIAYTRNGALLIASRSGESWQSVTVLPESRDVRGFAFAYGYESANDPYVVFTTGDTGLPLQCATPLLGEWRVQAIGTDPAFSVGQVPSLFASGGAIPTAHLTAVWNAYGLEMAWDNPNAIAFTRAQLIACPDSDVVSNVRFWYTTRYPVTAGPVLLDFRSGPVWDSVSVCGQYPTTLAADIGADTSARFVIKASGTVTGGISVTYGVINGTLIEPSVPLAGVDQDGDGQVTLTDRDLLASRFGTVDPRSDLDFDGDVDDADRQILLAHLWHTCAAAGVGPDDSPPAQEGLSLAIGPNPTRGGARVTMTLSQPSDVRVEVLDVACRRVRTLYEGEMTAGSHAITWDGRDRDGRATASGVYFVRARAGERVALARLARTR